MAARSVGRMWEEDGYEDPGARLRVAMRFSESTVDELLEAQEEALKAISPLVRPDVWKAALKAADGDTRRIMIFSPTEVHVVNNPGEKPPWLV